MVRDLREDGRFPGGVDEPVTQRERLEQRAEALHERQRALLLRAARHLLLEIVHHLARQVVVDGDRRVRERRVEQLST